MTIEIIEKVLGTDPTGDAPDTWAILIEIDNGINRYLLPVSLPGSIAAGNLQTTLEADETALFALAQAKNITATDLYTRAATNRVVKALALVTLDEINILRNAAGLALRTETQLRAAIKNKLKTL